MRASKMTNRPESTTKGTAKERGQQGKPRKANKGNQEHKNTENKQGGQRA